MTQPIQQPQIPQLSPQEASREMTPAEVRQLQDTIRNVRKVIARFHATRRKNNERMAGLRASIVWPQQAQEIAQRTREPVVEQQAVETLRQFLRVLRGHEPNRQEMQEGIPNGIEDQVAMGGIPLAVGAVAIALGTSVYSVFNYLGNHEQMIAQQTATPLERGLTLLSENIWGLAAVGVVVGGVYIYHRSQSAGDRKHKRELEKIREMGEVTKGIKLNPSHKMDDEEIEEESFFSKAKEFVRNGLFPEEKREGSEAKKLMENFERLSEEEQARFAEMMSGEYEDSEEEDEEESEVEAEVEENPSESEEETEETEEVEEDDEDEAEVEENPSEDEDEAEDDEEGAEEETDD